MTRYVYEFAEGDKDQQDLVGGKGVDLVATTNLGLPGGQADRGSRRMHVGRVSVGRVIGPDGPAEHRLSRRTGRARTADPARRPGRAGR